MVPRLIRIWRVQWWYSFLLFSTRSITFFGNLFQTIKTVCWNWNLESKLIPICRIQWWFSFLFFSFLERKYSFWVNLAQKCHFKLKLVTQAILNMENSMVMYTFCVLGHFLESFLQKICLTFWCYLINLPAVYSQRLQTSDFSCNI